MDEKFEVSCDFVTNRRHAGNRPITPFQLPLPPFGPLGEHGEGSSRQNCSLLGFLQQQGFFPSSVAEDGKGSACGSGPYSCVTCLAVFPSAWLLEQHNSLQHSINSRNSETGSPGEDKPFKCEQCGQSYRYRSAYLKHQEQNHRARLPADKLFTCDVCGMQFRYLKSFKKHRLNHALEKLHGKSPDGELLARARNNGALERYCRSVVESSIDLTSGALPLVPLFGYKVDEGVKESGRVTAPPSSTFVDERSDHVTDSNESLGNVCIATGIGNERAASVPLSKVERLNLLKFSKNSYRFKKNLMEPFYKKSAKSDRVSDSEQDETLDSLGCATVGSNDPFRYQQESSLVNLLRMDPSERHRENRFSCPFCGKCVRSKENLKLHIRKHTGERPFVCLFCGRAFGGKSDLTRHLRIHTGERPYHCEMCGKCFARADYLSKHLTTHIHSHNSRPSFSHATR